MSGPPPRSTWRRPQRRHLEVKGGRDWELREKSCPFSLSNTTQGILDFPNSTEDGRPPNRACPVLHRAAGR
jgi:hypothetical protein